jgi:hypothetical protein
MLDTTSQNGLDSSPRGFSAWLGKTSLPGEFPNHLANSEPGAVPVQRLDWRLLGALVLLCLLPRMLMACKLDVICNDGTLYIQMAEAWEHGNLPVAQGMPLNVYPFVLLGLHWLGLPWELAGKVWGVTAATLVVLPMFGFVRRQFNEQLAAWACVIYAIHPKLIEKSPELIRDQTFWLLFMLSLYLLWRAVTEVKLRWFALFTLVTLAAALTRFEAVFLAVPFLWWAGVRFVALKSGRARLAVGCLLVVGLVPAISAVAEVAWLADHPGFRLFNTDPLERAERWLESWIESSTESELPVSGPRERLGTREMFHAWINVIERGIHPIFILLMAVGYLHSPRMWNRRDHAALGAVGMLVALGIWVHLWYSQQVSTRHVLLIVLVSSRVAAWGLMATMIGARRLAEWYQAKAPVRRLAPVAIAVALGTMGWADALSSTETSARDRADVGRWIRNQYGASRLIVCSDNLSSLVGFYAETHCYSVPAQTRGPALIQTLEQFHPDVVVLSRPRLPRESYELLLAEHQRLGLAVIDTSRTPARDKEFVLLVREDAAASRLH